MNIKLDKKNIDTNLITEIIILNDNTNDCYEIHFKKLPNEKYFSYCHINENEKVAFAKQLKTKKDSGFVKIDSCIYNIKNIKNIEKDSKNANYDKIIYVDGYERNITKDASIKLSSCLRNEEFSK